MPPFIEVNGLTKRFGAHTIVDNLSLSLNEGDMAVIRGPSGIGKSTFLRCLTYLEPFDQGSIRVGNIEVRAGMDERRDHRTVLALREQLGHVFQFFNLFPHLTVLENITLGPRIVLKEAKEKAEEEAFVLLNKVGLSEKAAAYPSALSGGQQQRVAIARALAMHPKGILFDEPTSSLDPTMEGEVLRVLERFANDGLTMIIVTHEPGFVERMAGRVITFGPGCALESDSEFHRTSS